VDSRWGERLAQPDPLLQGCQREEVRELRGAEGQRGWGAHWVELDAGHTADHCLLKPTAVVQAAVVVLQCMPSQCRVQGAC